MILIVSFQRRQREAEGKLVLQICFHLMHCCLSMALPLILILQVQCFNELKIFKLF
ncbi:hypothetical protein HanPSC8_Chr04g0172611 [Helianthus annuus]|nr:hypothetical protein HanPSC8_Chr04g0172611 [Helianthus annuus]